MIDLDDQSVLSRRMDVTTRFTESVQNLLTTGEDDVLLETLVGRYVMNRDAREVWALIDGSRTVAQISDAIAGRRSASSAEIGPEVLALCGELLEFQLAEIPSDRP